MTILSQIITPTNVVTASNTETLTNKTIDASQNTLTGVQTTLVSGTNIKTVNGTSLLGSGDVAAGSYTLLASGSIANGTTNLDIETGFTDATYPEIVIVFSNVRAASGGGYWTSQFKIGGSYNTTANYAYSKFASGETAQNVTAQTNMLMGIHSMSTTVSNDSVFIVKNRFQRAAGAGVITCLMPRSDNANQIGMWWGYISVSGDIQGVRFFVTSSTVNFGSGTYAVYGFKYV